MSRNPNVPRALLLSTALLMTLGCMCCCGGGGSEGGGGAAGSCQAQGEYQVCTSSGGMRQCRSYTSEGMGVGADAASDAVQMCNDHMARMVITESINNNANIVHSCSVTSCN